MVMQSSLPVNLFLSSSVIPIAQTGLLLTKFAILLKGMSGKWEMMVGIGDGDGCWGREEDGMVTDINQQCIVDFKIISEGIYCTILITEYQLNGYRGIYHFLGCNLKLKIGLRLIRRFDQNCVC